MLDLRALGLLAVLAAGLCIVPRGYAQAADPPAYRATIDDAVREFASGHWEEARALFKRAHELSPNARTLRGMGMAAFELRMYTQAIRELDAALRDTRKPLEGDLRAQVTQLMDKSREFVGRVELVLEPKDAKALIDGKPPELEPDGSVLLDVGTHVISASADGYKPTNLRLAVEGGMDQSVRVPLEPLLAMQAAVPAIDPNHPPTPTPEAQPSPAPVAQVDTGKGGHLATYAWITLAGAAAFGIAGGITHFVIGQGQYDDIKTRKKNECEPSCTREQVDLYVDESGVKTSDTLATVFFVAAGAFAATTIVLFAIDASSGKSDTQASAAQPQVALAVSPAGMSLRGQF
jgi:hypothetical protein